jgi:hypothetical protein
MISLNNNQRLRENNPKKREISYRVSSDSLLNPHLNVRGFMSAKLNVSPLTVPVERPKDAIIVEKYASKTA